MKRFISPSVAPAVAALTLVGALAALTSGCSSKPYCLNCSEKKDLGVGDLLPGDANSMPDLSPGNLDGSNGNGNGDGGPTTCNLTAQQLSMDPNNCGFCGNVCDFTGHHQLGACVIGDGGTPGCQPSACAPGWVNLTGNPADGCFYQCTIASLDGGVTDAGLPVDVCNGIDDDCDGKIDNGYTSTYDPNGTPRYDSDPNNCGGCGLQCEIPGANNVCVLNTTIDKGQCQVGSCINSVAQGTYRHNPSAGDINVTGCEYHCPSPAASPGIDCNSDGACTFPQETCNGIDDDCDFIVDDHLTDPTLNQACGTACPGGKTANCLGACKAGTTLCKSGALVCTGSTGPSPEICDGVDNDCNGKIDDPFTSTYSASGQPNYDVDPQNCGACGGVCSLANAVNGCHGNGGTQLGACYVVSCNAGFNYASKVDSSGHACNGALPGPENSSPGNPGSGVGCYYMCPIPAGKTSAPPATPEVCDGYDNDCNGCVDDSLTPPNNFCSKQGVCAGTGPGQSPATLFCNGASGWQCDYYTTLKAKGAPVDLSANAPTGTLLPTEAECDGLDNNCNGACDENFPFTAVTNASCTNVGRTAKSCTTGQGVCQETGAYACSSDTTTEVCSNTSVVPPVALSANGDLTKATNELCNGKDDDCNGLIDENTSYTVGGHTYQGWHDPVVQVAVPADPSYQGLAAHTVYIYEYEASRPDATSTSPGSLTTRACANVGTTPWATVTQTNAQAACAAAGGRLCTALEWQTSCEGPTPPAPPLWSMSPNPASYPSGGGVCNDANQATTHAVWATGTAGRVTSQSCLTNWGAAGNISDLSGNLEEWTETPTYTYQDSGSTATIVSMGTAGTMRITNITGTPAAITVGALVQTSGSATASHNGTFQVTAVSTTNKTVDVANAGFPATGVNDKGPISWEAVVANTYYALRGGSYTSPQGGTTCEFNFDIAQATFANNDVGFRCCFTTKP